MNDILQKRLSVTRVIVVMPSVVAPYKFIDKLAAAKELNAALHLKYKTRLFQKVF